MLKTHRKQPLRKYDVRNEMKQKHRCTPSLKNAMTAIGPAKYQDLLVTEIDC
jgi:hypothetical protein